jgi:antitoxin component YwqK of YwqJK toxin-antitoxin module
MEMGSTAPRARLVTKLLIGLLLGSCTRQATLIKAYSVDAIRLTSKNGVLYNGTTEFTGKLYALYPNGDSLFSRTYINGVEDGVHTIWYPDAHIQQIRRFKEGKKNGHSIAYWPAGKKRYEYYFRDDLYEGIQYEWYSNGKPYLKKTYKDGYEDGLQQSWKPDGSALSNYEARNGRNYGNIGKKNCYSVWQDSAFVSIH